MTTIATTITVEILKGVETKTKQFNDYDVAVEFLQKCKQDENSDAFLNIIQNNDTVKKYLAEHCDYRMCVGEQIYSSYKGMTEEYSESFDETDFYYDLEKAKIKLSSQEIDVITDFGYSCMYDDGDVSSPTIYTFYAVFNKDFTSYEVVVEDRDNY